MKNRALSFLSLFALLLLPSFLHSYDLVLKNGKTIRGTLINETEELIVLRDTSGTQINFKKTAVDLEKTRSANLISAAPAEQTPEPAKAEQTAPQNPAQTKKKPARVMTEADIQRLRDKYDLGEGLYNARQAESSTAGDAEKKNKSEYEWRAQAQQYTEHAQQAEQLYNQLKDQCDILKNATVQTHMVYSGTTGKSLPIAETREEMCNRADDARAAFAEARQQYQDFMQSARRENVPPGYLSTDPEYQEKLEKDQDSPQQ